MFINFLVLITYVLTLSSRNISATPTASPPPAHLTAFKLANGDILVLTNAPPPPPPTGTTLQLGTPNGGGLSLGVPPLGAPPNPPPPQLTPANIPTFPIRLPLPQLSAQLPIPQLIAGPFSIAGGPTVGLNLDNNGLSGNLGVGAGAGVGGNNAGVSAGTGFSVGSSGLSFGADAGALAGPSTVGTGVGVGLANIDSQNILLGAGAQTLAGVGPNPTVSEVGLQALLPGGTPLTLPPVPSLQLGPSGLPGQLALNLPTNQAPITLGGPPTIISLGGHPYLAVTFSNGQIMLAPSQLPKAIPVQSKSSSPHPQIDRQNSDNNNNEKFENRDNQYLNSNK